MSVGPMEIMVILVVALLVFGPQRLPEVGRQVGGALRELRRMQDTVRGELDMVLHPEHGTSSTHAEIEPGDHTAYADGDTFVEPDTLDDVYTDGPDNDGPDLDGDRSDRGTTSETDRGFAGPPDSFT